MKKALSIMAVMLFAAAALIFTEIGVCAATGDVLANYDFEDVSPVTDSSGNITSWTNGWDGSRNDSKISAFYGNLTDAGEYFTATLGAYRKPEVQPPAITGEKSMYIASSGGSNAHSNYKIYPAISASGTGVYDISFDLMLVSADYGGPAEKEYYIALGDETNYNFKLSVNDDLIYYWDGGTMIATEECTDVITEWGSSRWYIKGCVYGYYPSRI